MSNALLGLLGAVKDPQFRQDVGRGLLDAGNRGAVAGLLGGPVDLASMAMRPLGYSVEKPVGGSEWFGQKMQDVGMVTPTRNSLAEALAAFAVPAGVQQAGPKLFAAEQRMAQNMATPGPVSGGPSAQLGMIRSPLGRIPETFEERSTLRDLLTRYAQKSGYEVSQDAAFSGASLYSTISNPRTGAEAVVRMSDHQPAMKYVPPHTPYFSVDKTDGAATAGGTFEQAVDWLGRNGLPINNLGPRSSSLLEKAAQQKAASDAAHQSLMASRNQAIQQRAVNNGGAYLESVKLNSGGRRYDVFRADGSKVSAYSRDLPEQIKTGDRNTLMQWILSR